MRTQLLSFAIVFCTFPLFSQDYQAANLVNNHSFEEPVDANQTFSTTDVITNCANWNSPNLGEPAIYTHTDRGYVYDSYGSAWNFKARTGKNVAGMEVYGSSDSNRDYIQGTLKEPLEVGKKYYFSFWVHYHCSGANNIGIAFLPEKVKVDSTGRLPLKPATYQAELTPYDKTNSWTLVRDSFVAYKPFQHFIIGNFFTDEETKLEGSKGGHYFAYVDDIEVIAAAEEEEVTMPETDKEESWSYNETIIENAVQEEEAEAPEPAPTPAPEVLTEKTVPQYDNITFDQSSARLSKASLSVLSRLVDAMKNNPAQRVIIKGFASSEGDEGYNQKLSGKRAQTVLDFLLAEGLDASRIMMQALGESNPLVPNDSEENRRKNRRVELEILN